MSNKKQTAVSWLEQRVLSIVPSSQKDDLIKLFEQAKAMEIDQHQTSFNEGYEDHIVETWGEEDPKGFEGYFTETFIID